jgi:Flp pilus assembly protein TadG
MVHRTYVPWLLDRPQSIRVCRSRRANCLLVAVGPDAERGSTVVVPHAWKIVEKTRRRGENERGAEMVEFAIVVVLLITLLYGIITYGLILAAQATITQAAADAARSGLTVGSATAVATAETQACTDVGWMNKSCATPTSTSDTVCPGPVAGSAITASACEETCPSNSLETCLTVSLIFNYSSNPLFPELPGLDVITPSIISSTNVLQLN